jgi:DNA/RNA endonuclease G (NUC1)
MYNTSNNENLQRCAMTVDNVENVTRFDFFPELDDDTENYLESSFKLKYWGL